MEKASRGNILVMILHIERRRYIVLGIFLFVIDTTVCLLKLLDKKVTNIMIVLFSTAAKCLYGNPSLTIPPAFLGLYRYQH